MPDLWRICNTPSACPTVARVSSLSLAQNEHSASARVKYAAGREAKIHFSAETACSALSLIISHGHIRPKSKEQKEQRCLPNWNK